MATPTDAEREIAAAIAASNRSLLGALKELGTAQRKLLHLVQYVGGNSSSIPRQRYNEAAAAPFVHDSSSPLPWDQTAWDAAEERSTRFKAHCKKVVESRRSPPNEQVADISPSADEDSVRGGLEGGQTEAHSPLEKYLRSLPFSSDYVSLSEHMGILQAVVVQDEGGLGCTNETGVATVCGECNASYDVLYGLHAKKPLLAQLPFCADAAVFTAFPALDESVAPLLKHRRLEARPVYEDEVPVPWTLSSIPVNLYTRIVALAFVWGCGPTALACIVCVSLLQVSGTLDSIFWFWQDQLATWQRRLWLLRQHRPLQDLLNELAFHRQIEHQLAVAGTAAAGDTDQLVIADISGAAQLSSPPTSSPLLFTTTPQEPSSPFTTPPPSAFESWLLARPRLIPIVLYVEWWVRWVYQSFILLVGSLYPSVLVVRPLVVGPSLWPTVYLVWLTSSTSATAEGGGRAPTAAAENAFPADSTDGSPAMGEDTEVRE